MSLGLSVRVLEAKGRIGGRAVTDTESLGVTWDRGAHWLHHAHSNPLADFARSQGFDIEIAPSTPFLWDSGCWAGDDVARRRDLYFERAFAAIRQSGAAGRDVVAGDVIPHDPEFRSMFDSWYAAVSGTEPDRASTLDDYRYKDDPDNWRPAGGYGAIVARYGNGLPISLSTPARQVRWDEPMVVVETPRGTLPCRAVIVTVPTTALARDALRFEPVLPPAVAAAFDALPLGPAEKVAIAFDRDILDLPPNSSLHFTHDSLEAIRFQIKPFGAPLAVGHLSGRFAADIESAGATAMTAFALEKLVDVFGADIRRSIRATATTHWTSDQDICGGYSCALPGMADQRHILRKPLGERLYFAGEACSIAAYGTVHGAYESGVETAQRVAAHLRGKNDTPGAEFPPG